MDTFENTYFDSSGLPVYKKQLKYDFVDYVVKNTIDIVCLRLEAIKINNNPLFLMATAIRESQILAQLHIAKIARPHFDYGGCEPFGEVLLPKFATGRIVPPSRVNEDDIKTSHTL